MNQNIIIEAFGIVVKGKLIYHKEGMKKNRLPDILIVQKQEGMHLLKGWNIVEKVILV